jgi:membrane protein
VHATRRQHRRFGRPTEPYTLDDTIARLLEVLPPHYRVYVVARRVIRGLFRHHAFDHAATMAFYFFLGTIPLLLLAGMLLGVVVHETGAPSLLEPLYRLVPGATAEMIRTELRNVAAAPIGSYAPLSFAGFLYLTSNGFHNLMDVFEYLAGSAPVPWWRQRLLAIGWVVLALITLFATFGILLGVNGLFVILADHTAPDAVRVLRVLENIQITWRQDGLLLIVGTVMTLWLAAFFRLSVSHPRAVRRRVWPGTFVAMTLFVLVSWAFGAYVRTLGDYAVFYGSVTTIAVTLLWLYLASLAVLTGAEVNAQLEGLRDVPQKQR